MTIEKQTYEIEVPDDLIYETIDWKPVYYSGYRNVLSKNISIDEIMGCSSIQSLIISLLTGFLLRNLNSKEYQVMGSELGLHIDAGSNLAADIAIFIKSQLHGKITNNYITVAPKIIFEIDAKADLNDFDAVMNYFDAKTKKLFTFGVETVYWVISANRKIMIAQPGKNWMMINWNESFTILDGCTINLQELIDENGLIN